jgi:hypothetical protein
MLDAALALVRNGRPALCLFLLPDGSKHHHDLFIVIERQDMSTLRRLYWTLGLFAVSVLAAPTCEAAIVFHYPFEGNALDVVGGHNGTLVGDATFSGNVPPGIGSTQSLFLDGTLDKVIYDASAADLLNGNFTIAAWVNAASRRPDSTLTFVGTRSPEDHGVDFKYFVDSEIRLDIGNGSSFLTISDHPVTYNLNEWHHVAVVVQPSQYELFFDGVSQGVASMSPGTPLLLDADHDLAIGSINAVLTPNGPPLGEDFHGWIDDVRIYNTALTGDEIRSAMQGAEPTSTILIGLGALTIMGWRRR